MNYIKITNFWKTICEELSYKLYLGVPVLDLKLIFDTMSSDKLHYIPTINELTAVGMASGAYLSGVKSVVLMQSVSFDLLHYNINKFSYLYKIPFLFIVNDDFNPLGLKQFELSKGLSVLNEADNYMYRYEFKPSILVVKQGDLI